MSQYIPLEDNGQRFDSDTYSTTWLKYPYGVRLQEDPSTAFKCIKDYEDFVLEGEQIDDTIAKYNEIMDSDVMTDLPGSGIGEKIQINEDRAEFKFFNSPIFTDSRIGCNDAINPYWQFNRDDDIRPPMMFPATIAAGETYMNNTADTISDLKHACGMGRVYSEMYDAHQQILWIEAGVPKFTNLLEFYRDAADADVAQAINRGTLSNFGQKLFGKLLKVALWPITVPIMSVYYLSRWLDLIANERVTKYYSFQPAMTMYYETVNTMLQYVSVAMGIHPFTLEQHKTGSGSSHIDNGAEIVRKYDIAGAVVETEEEVTYINKTTGKVERKKVKKKETKPATYDSLPGIPEILREGPDIFKIMNRRARMININCQSVNSSTVELMRDEMKGNGGEGSSFFLAPIPDASYSQDGWIFKKVGDGFKNWYGALKGSVFGSGSYVGFKVERGLSCSESFSNTTGETGIASKLNSISSKYKEENESFGNSAAERIVGKTVDNVVQGDKVADGLQNVMSEIKRGALSAAANISGFDIGSVLVTGNGFLDIPEVWRNSTFTRSYSFNIQLRSRYGDPVSIFQSIYIPMLMLMALAAPRAIGTNMYTSPFIVRAFVRGMMAVPLGIVEHMDITRGSDDYGWSSNYLPTSVDISFGIKDLSPTLFLSMQENGIFDTFSRNSNLLEYLDTLAALGLKEKIYFFPKLFRKINTALSMAKTTIFSATYWGTRMGQSKTGRIFQAMVPFSIDMTSRR